MAVRLRSRYHSASSSSDAASSASTASSSSSSSSSSSWTDAFIDNHADIFVSICLLLFIAYMIPATSFISAPFVTPQYNFTTIVHSAGRPPIPLVLYGTGPSDISLTIFLVFIWISVHAIIYEFGLMTLVRKLKLIRDQIAPFYESAILAFFYGFSAYWAFNIVSDEGLVVLSNLTSEFPYKEMTLSTKMFLLSSLAYWLHAIPELMLIHVPEKYWNKRIVKYTTNAAFVGAAYYLQYSKVAVLILLAQYATDFLFEFSRFMKFLGAPEGSTRFLSSVNFARYSKQGFKAWGFTFAFTRLVIGSVAVRVLWLATPTTSEQPATAEGEQPSIASEAEPDVPRYIFTLALLLVQGLLSAQFVKHIATHPDGLSSLFGKKSKKSKEGHKSDGAKALSTGKDANKGSSKKSGAAAPAGDAKKVKKDQQ